MNFDLTDFCSRRLSTGPRILSEGACFFSLYWGAGRGVLSNGMDNCIDRLRIVGSLVAALLPALGVNLAAQGDSRLADAVMKRDGAAVRSLLGQKVDVNAPGKDGTPALHWSVREDDLETARLLVGAGADAKLANRYGVTPLILACSNGNTAMIRLLLDAGADPNAEDPTGETALMEAARVGTLDAVKLLLERGAVLDARDPAFQQTALMVAVKHARRDWAQCITNVVDRAKHTVGGAVSGTACNVGDVSARSRRRDRDTCGVSQDHHDNRRQRGCQRERKDREAADRQAGHNHRSASDPIRHHSDDRSHHQGGDGLDPEEPTEL